MPATPKNARTPSAQAQALDETYGPVETKQLNTRVTKGLVDNLAFVAKLTGESTADIVAEAVQAAVDERLGRPEVRAALEALLDRSKAVTA